ncbi:solute carrier family 22 member 15-like [Nematostella vectensis]|uniref:solute carrier family 22 member 15-like n=1 Tax=Nematostella vectensis TaxID=45351 RepID=UPI0020777DB8|nr:solute carrier family 22 member 15-like [Nematostella vectensis]
MEVDEVLIHVGQFGRSQWRVLGMFLFIFFPVTYQTLIMVFVAYEPPWMCTANSSSCLLPNATGREVYSTATKPISLYQRRCQLNRSEWKFADEDMYEGPVNTIVTEFDLVCERGFLAWLANSMLFCGWALGAIVLGIIADKFGRKSVLFPAVFFIITVTFAMSFVEQAWLVILFRFVVGVFEAGCLSMFVLSTELVGPKHRALAGTMVWFYFTAALLAIGLKAYFIRDWSMLCIASTAPYIFVLFLYKCVPESVRWLLVAGREPEARKIIEDVARVNKKQMPETELRVPKIASNKGVIELFRTRKLAILTLIQCYAWFVNGMVYYGVSMSSGDFGGSIYLNFVLTSLVEIPGNWLVIDNCNRFGRKKTVVAHMILGAIACVSVSFIPDGTDNIAFIAGRVTGGTLGKLFITCSFNSIYVFSAELFPTMVRNSGMGLVSVTSRFGAASAPFVVQMTRINTVLPFALMGSLTFIAAVACWFLPETRGKPTQEVMDDTDRTRHKGEVLFDEKPGRGQKDVEDLPHDNENVAKDGEDESGIKLLSVNPSV